MSFSMTLIKQKCLLSLYAKLNGNKEQLPEWRARRLGAVGQRDCSSSLASLQSAVSPGTGWALGYPAGSPGASRDQPGLFPRLDAFPQAAEAL